MMNHKPSYEELERKVKMLEDSLSNREAILDHLPDHVVVQDLDHGILWANKSACKSLGIDRSEIMDRRCHELWAMQSGPCTDCPIPEAIEKTSQTSIEKTTPDGRSWRIRCYPILDAQGKCNRILEVTEDISETVTYCKTKQEAEKNRKLILDTMQEMLAYHDANLRVKWANKAAAKSVGKQPEDLVGLHCYEIWQQRAAPCENCPVLKAIETGKAQESEAETPGGRVYSIRGYPIFDENQKRAIGAVEYGLDITESKKAQQALIESEERFRLLSNLLSTPLRGTFRLISPG